MRRPVERVSKVQLASYGISIGSHTRSPEYAEVIVTESRRRPLRIVDAKPGIYPSRVARDSAISRGWRDRIESCYSPR